MNSECERERQRVCQQQNPIRAKKKVKASVEILSFNSENRLLCHSLSSCAIHKGQTESVFKPLPERKK